jgi:tetratricopeptide (TPR) repeat protein
LAANKRKILEAARKYAQKGAKDRALKEYEQLLKLDPKDAKLRLEIGDAHRRWGQVEEAIAAYSKVADQYMKEGFDARAVAVFKQIQNLAPDRFESYEPLAELYQRMGLTAEAIAALQTAADGYHRQGKKRDALELLRKMATLDPTNTGSRLKVADLLRQEKLFDAAVEEYEEVAKELERQGVTEAVGTVLERILELEPDREPAMRAFAKNLLARGMGERAEPYAKRLLDKNPAETDNYELLAEVYRAQHREDALTDVYRRLADVYRRRGDEENARQILQRFVPPDALSVDPTAAAEEMLLEREAAAPDESSLIDDEFLDDGLGEDLLEVSEPPGRAAPRSVAEETVLAGPGDGADAGAASADVEQLFAEASVYLRYGKRAQAIENLHAILVQDPRHRAALEKLGDAHADAREPQEAVEAWLRAAELAREERDTEALVLLRDRIGALDEAAAAQVAEWLPEEAEVPEIELDAVETEEIERPKAPARPAAPKPPPEQAFELGDIEIEVEDEGEDEDDAEAEDDDAVDPAAATVQAARKPAAAAPAPPGESASASASQQVAEDLEEADFYYQQGLHDEAEAIYQRVVARAPNHPLALVRLGEIAAARGTDPGATGSAKVAAPVVDEEPAAASDPDIGSDLADWGNDLAADSQPSVARAADSDGELEIEVEDEPSVVPAPARAAAAPEPSLADLAEEESEEPVDTDEDTASDLGASAPTAPIPAAGEADFDLAAELSDAFDDDGDGASGSGARAADDGFAAVFSEFKKGVSKTLGAGDHEAHYDLGIAYREMGLLGDAAAEFRAAMGSPARRIDCLHMLGLCTLDQGGAAAAAEHFETALRAPEATPEQQLALRFELGRAYESLGDRARARGAFEAVAAVDPTFCNVEEWLERVEEGRKPEPPEAAAGGGFESFEDLMSEGAEEAPAAEISHESFEDVVTEANQDEADEPVALDEPLEAEPEPAEEPPPRAAVRPGRMPAAKPARKKKISFV